MAGTEPNNRVSVSPKGSWDPEKNIRFDKYQDFPSSVLPVERYSSTVHGDAFISVLQGDRNRSHRDGRSNYGLLADNR